jgi:hypothetical protein
MANCAQKDADNKECRNEPQYLGLSELRRHSVLDGGKNHREQEANGANELRQQRNTAGFSGECGKSTAPLTTIISHPEYTP